MSRATPRTPPARHGPADDPPDVFFRPSGACAIDAGSEPELSAAFARGDGHAVLHLSCTACTAPAGSRPPGLAWLAAIGRSALERLRRTPDLDEAVAPPDVTPSPSDIHGLLATLPAVRGAEYVTEQVVEHLFRAPVAALGEEVTAAGTTVGAWLTEHVFGLNAVGRVCLHLAEDARDAERPFAFLATYTTRLSAAGGSARHRPLGRALQEYAAATDRDALLTLLRPLRRAAGESALIRELLDSEDVFRALRWTPAEAYALLREVPRLEAAGIVVRVPDWWRARRGARPVVRITVGGAPASGVGADALLDFHVDCALDGEPLTDAEWAALLGATERLVRLRGRWVEVDPERLQGLMDHWRGIDAAARAGGVSFVEGLRLLAGVDERGVDDDAADDAAADWVETAAGPWLAERLARLRAQRAEVSPVPGLRAELRPYQRRGVAWLQTLTELGLGGCLADDMGLGKTVQVLALLSRLRTSGGDGAVPAVPHLLVVPASLLANWSAEAERFTPSLRLLVAHPSFTPRTELAELDAERLREVDVVLTSYGTLRRLPWVTTQHWHLVVVDEAQAVKNPSAQQTRAVKRLKARARFALTGTPVENRLGDLWSILDFTCPGLLGSAKQFSRFARRFETDAAPAAYAALRELIAPYVLRRLKTDPEVAPDLPDKTEVRVRCPLTRDQAALYEKAVARLAETLAERREGMQRRGAVLAAILGLKQICNHPDQWLGTGSFEPVRSGKFVRLGEIAAEVASRQEKLLLFTQFRELTAPLAAHLATVFGCDGLVLHGGTPVRERGRMVETFQSEAGPPFFVLSLRAGGTGLNLTAAQHVVHFDRWWNPAVEDQATDRAFRIGQQRNVLVHKFVCHGTVEEKIDALIDAMRDLAERIVGDGGPPAELTELSDDELLRVIRLDLSAVTGD